MKKSTLLIIIAAAVFIAATGLLLGVRAMRQNRELRRWVKALVTAPTPKATASAPKTTASVPKPVPKPVSKPKASAPQPVPAAITPSKGSRITRNQGLSGALLCRRETSGAPEKPVGRLRLFILDDTHIVVAGDYQEFLERQIRTSYGRRLTFADREFAGGRLPEFSHRFLYNFAALELLSEFHPQIRDAFQTPGHFQLRTDRAELAIARQGYWINAVGLMRIARLKNSGEQLLKAGELVHFAYFELARPLTNGEKLTVTSGNGEQSSVTFDDRRSVSRAIKLNQEGYLADAGRKYAYLGMWQGTLGELPTAQRAGEKFYLRRVADDQEVFTGKIALRSTEQTVLRLKRPTKLYGETVMELDFSAFTTPGRYYLHIPGVGRSWDFTVGDDAIGRAFYVQMRGFFQQRSGIAKPPELTGWPIGADHLGSRRGGFVPNDRHYKGKTGRFTDASGKHVDLRSHFDMVKATATTELLPEVRGGWWDAGDFDRRTYHFAVVDALLSSYLLAPGKFSDRQLDIPESGNGIPDIVDEAAWGVEVWRRAQNAAGGVGCWLEATSHPANPDPVADVQPYYLALPTRESTIEYAAYAAKLARAYLRAAQPELARRYRESAEKAWDFAMNPANRLTTAFTHPELGRLFYSEPETLPEELVYKAALNLFMLTQAPCYAAELTDKRAEFTIYETRQRLGALFLSELAEVEKPAPELFIAAGKYAKMIVAEADKLLKSQEELAYRNVNHPLQSGYFTFLGWGNGLPPRRGAFFTVAHHLTGRARYRDAALLLVDWMLGANPMGRTFTTGLGQVYPIRLLSLPNWVMSSTLLDPIPGLTIYGFTGRSNYNAATMIFAIDHEPRADHHFKGVNRVLLPATLTSETSSTPSAINEILSVTLPLWRRHANLESYAVDQNEFTVWETMAPAAALYAALLPEHWTPPPDWKNRQPVRDKEKLPGYFFLP